MAQNARFKHYFGIQGVQKVLNIVISHTKHVFIVLFRACLKAFSSLFPMSDCFCISVNRESRKCEFTASACFGMLRNIGLGSPLGRKARLTEFTLGKSHLLNRKYQFLYDKQIVS